MLPANDRFITIVWKIWLYLLWWCSENFGGTNTAIEPSKPPLAASHLVTLSRSTSPSSKDNVAEMSQQT